MANLSSAAANQCNHHQLLISAVLSVDPNITVATTINLYTQHQKTAAIKLLASTCP